MDLYFGFRERLLLWLKTGYSMIRVLDKLYVDVEIDELVEADT